MRGSLFIVPGVVRIVPATARVPGRDVHSVDDVTSNIRIDFADVFWLFNRL